MPGLKQRGIAVAARSQNGNANRDAVNLAEDDGKAERAPSKEKRCGRSKRDGTLSERGTLLRDLGRAGSGRGR